MALRLLLTLLALLTGLAAQLSPAQARIGAGADSAIGAVSGAELVQRRGGAVAIASRPAQDHSRHFHATPNVASADPVILRPGALPGIDRARE